MYSTNNLQLGYYELLLLADSTSVTVTATQVSAVEKATKDQASCRLWHRMRIGRITASVFKHVCHTDLASPSLSLIMSVCHPETIRSRTKATEWGCQHEKIAIKKYQECCRDVHIHHDVCVSGFFINEINPFLGASPDALVECDCCGKGICEVKVCIQ